jgi:hypothetical protein
MFASVFFGDVALFISRVDTLRLSKPTPSDERRDLFISGLQNKDTKEIGVQNHYLSTEQ